MRYRNSIDFVADSRWSYAMIRIENVENVSDAIVLNDVVVLSNWSFHSNDRSNFAVTFSTKSKITKQKRNKSDERREWIMCDTGKSHRIHSTLIDNCHRTVAIRIRNKVSMRKRFSQLAKKNKKKRMGNKRSKRKLAIDLIW